MSWEWVFDGIVLISAVTFGFRLARDFPEENPRSVEDRVDRAWETFES